MAGREGFREGSRSRALLLLLIITVSFIPVFSLEGQEGRLFKPLAFTKTFAMAAASILSLTVVPVAMGLFIRGGSSGRRPIQSIEAHRGVSAPYLVRPPPSMGSHRCRARGVVLTAIPWARIGSEFMPPLDEGTILFMPTTLPGASVARAREILRIRTDPQALSRGRACLGQGGARQHRDRPGRAGHVRDHHLFETGTEWPTGMTAESW